ncbi:uncharacterized protein LOC114340303 [Diabrotica virgifera virgifera]|nr:uncharacterized protein LOC114340303 [Diabrotica virgifera virgifera]
MEFAENKLFGPQIHFWPMIKNSILAAPFGEIIRRLNQAGIFSNWKHREIEYFEALKVKKKSHQNIKIFVLQDMYPPLVLLLIGLSVAAMIFVKEKLCKTELQ